MPCDIDANLKRVHWEYDQTANAPCLAQWGFRLDGSMTREYWWEFTETQTADIWTWLDGGGVMVSEDPPEGTPTGQFAFRELGGIHEVILTYVGSSTGLQPPPPLLTVNATLLITTVILVDPEARGRQASTQTVDRPPNNAGWLFGNWSDVSDPPLITEPPQGLCRVTPLKRCHDCVRT